MGYEPFVMVYEKPTAPPITRKFQRWVNNKWFFHAVPDFGKFDPGQYRKKKGAKFENGQAENGV